MQFTNKPTKIIVHHSGGTDANPLQDSSNYTVEQCNQDHKVRFNFISSMGSYVGYQYFMDKDGVITQCRADTEEGAHTIGQNNSSIGICLAGNFDATLPKIKQTEALRVFLLKKTKEFNIDPKDIYPHRHFAKKSCYGSRLPDNWASELIQNEEVLTKEEKQVIEDSIKIVQQAMPYPTLRLKALSLLNYIASFFKK